MKGPDWNGPKPNDPERKAPEPNGLDRFSRWMSKRLTWLVLRSSVRSNRSSLPLTLRSRPRTLIRCPIHQSYAAITTKHLSISATTQTDSRHYVPCPTPLLLFHQGRSILRHGKTCRRKLNPRNLSRRQISHKLRRIETPLEIPYGVAIAIATIPVLAERYFYQFAA